jgi:hypothetical protein
MVTVLASGGVVEPHDMRRVDHYDREMVVMPDGKVMCQYTPVFETRK